MILVVDNNTVVNLDRCWLISCYAGENEDVGKVFLQLNSYKQLLRQFEDEEDAERYAQLFMYRFSENLSTADDTVQLIDLSTYVDRLLYS